MSRDWHAWHEQYDDPASSLSRRLTVVREQLRLVLSATEPQPDRAVRLVSLCSGDGRDTLPVLAESPVPVAAMLIPHVPDCAVRYGPTY